MFRLPQVTQYMARTSYSSGVIRLLGLFPASVWRLLNVQLPIGSHSAGAILEVLGEQHKENSIRIIGIVAVLTGLQAVFNNSNYVLPQ